MMTILITIIPVEVKYIHPVKKRKTTAKAHLGEKMQDILTAKQATKQRKPRCTCTKPLAGGSTPSSKLTT